MKQSKWYKWQVGMVASLAAAFLVHEIKTSPAFSEASENSAANNQQDQTQRASSNQDFMDDWAGSVDGVDEYGQQAPSSQDSSSGSSPFQPSDSGDNGSGNFSFSHSQTGRS